MGEELTENQKEIYGWHQRGYKAIPDEAPPELEAKCWAPSWRRMCKVLLRNDYWCKGLGQAQPKSEAYEKFKEIMRQERETSKEDKGLTDWQGKVLDFDKLEPNP